MNEARTARPRRLTSVGAPEAWPCGRAHRGQGLRDVGRGPRRKETDDETAPRTLDVGGARGRRGTGRSRVGGWASTTPRRRRGARAQPGWGHPGAWGEGRDSGFWLARRSPARASVAGLPPRQAGQETGLDFGASSWSSASPKREVWPSAVSCDAEGSHRSAAATGDRLLFERPARCCVKVVGGSAPAASRRGDVRP